MVTAFYQIENVLSLSFCPTHHKQFMYSKIQDVLGEQLGNVLQNCCSQVSSSVPDCTVQTSLSKIWELLHLFYADMIFYTVLAFCNNNSGMMSSQ
jgi:hypothetical protein